MLDPESRALSDLPRFPFRDVDAGLLGHAIAEHEVLIRACVKRRLPRKYESHVEDVEQEVRLALLRALPRFDQSLGFKLSTFLYTCIHRALADQLERLDREPTPTLIPADAPAPGDWSDVAALADSLKADPESFLTAKQAALFRMRVAGLDRQTIADRLGITPYSVSRATTRLRKKIIEFVQLSGPPPYHTGDGSES